ncbi:MAG: NUDIX hydrolase [Gammaproteobacteria bacterium]|nr:MAG: NUDIX hydrolase [Gammaproteobacteria bacterium]
MNFCTQCGHPVTVQVPDGDNRPRYVCGHCGQIHYENPRLVVGCVVAHRDAILLCRRAIEPRHGFWTVPAGFMELGETLADAALRETWEEAEARVELGSLFVLVDVVHARQVHVFFRGTLAEPVFGAGHETIETRLFSPAEIPWRDIAFPSVTIALERYLASPRDDSPVHLAAAPRFRLI